MVYNYILTLVNQRETSMSQEKKIKIIYKTFKEINKNYPNIKLGEIQYKGNET